MRRRHTPLRLPLSRKKAVERLSKQDGTNINQFVAMGVAENLPAKAMKYLLHRGVRMRTNEPPPPPGTASG